MNIVFNLVKPVRKTVRNLILNLPGLRIIMLKHWYKSHYKINFGKIVFQGGHFQDLIAYLYLRNIKNGFYIDIGANDGISGSNTYIFEQSGWNGICIEPDPDTFAKLIKYRKCDCYNIAVSESVNESVDFFKAARDTRSGINASVSESAKQIESKYGKCEIIKVKTTTFNEIMKNYKNTHIDFMSIDVEGHEMAVLNSIDFSKYSFGFITIEKSEPEKIKNLLSKYGYRYFIEIGSDIMFTPPRNIIWFRHNFLFFVPDL